MNRHFTVRLADVAEIERNGIAPSDIVAGTTYVGLEHIGAGGSSVSRSTVGAGELGSNKFRFTNEHILYGKLRPYLAKIVAPDFSGICSTDILPIRPGPRIEKAFLLHYLRLPENVAWAAGRATGVNLPRLSPGELADLSVPLPPLDEQRRIAAILDKADALRQKRKQAVALLDRLTRSVVVEAMNAALEAQPLEELTTEIYRYPTYYGIAYLEAGVPEIRGELIRDDGSVDNSSDALRYISEATSRRFPKTILDEGDLVMSVRGTIGKIGRVPPELAGANMTANLIRLAPNRRKVVDAYLWEVMRSEKIRAALMKASSSTTIATIKSDDLRALSIPVPSMEIQRAFSEARQRLTSCRERLVTMLSSSEALFASLQHRAFSGELQTQ